MITLSCCLGSCRLKAGDEAGGSGRFSGDLVFEVCAQVAEGGS